MKALAYDLEIINAIPNRSEPPAPGINYCAGWHDHAGMGVSVLCAYDFHTKRFRVFCEDNQEDFFTLANDRMLVTFNGLRFDNRVVASCWNGGVDPDTILRLLEENHYDLLFEAKKSKNSGRLDAYGEHNFGEQKSDEGKYAPVWWQQGQIGRVTDYCLQDVKLTANLFTKVVKEGGLKSPSGSDAWVPMLEPFLELTSLEKEALTYL